MFLSLFEWDLMDVMNLIRLILFKSKSSPVTRRYSFRRKLSVTGLMALGYRTGWCYKAQLQAVTYSVEKDEV